MILQIQPSTQHDLLLPLLRDADESDNRIQQALANPANTAYLVSFDDQPIGAVVMHWHTEESEILYIAIASEQRGKGFGKRVIDWIIAEGRGRGVDSIIVGTGNSSLDNIAFYQKCGFRMDAIRPNYFDDLPTPVYEHGIQLRDMLMLRHRLAGG